MDNLVYLESQITETFSKNSILLSILFDIKKSIRYGVEKKADRGVVKYGNDGTSREICKKIY